MPSAPSPLAHPPAGDAASTLDARVDAFSARIICNCDCGNKIVQKCYCGVADSLRAEIRSRFAAGEGEEQALAYFVGRYGESILASPAPEGFNLTAWAAPGAALLAGLLFAVLLLRRWSRRSAAAADDAAHPSPIPSPLDRRDVSDPYEKAFEAEYASRGD